jgi:hypothetical protein
VKVIEAFWAIWDALDANFIRLAQRLREGVATPDELRLSADIHEGKVKPRHPKGGVATNIRRDNIAQTFHLLMASHPTMGRKQIIGHICDYFEVGSSHVEEILATIDPERLQQIQTNVEDHLREGRYLHVEKKPGEKKPQLTLTTRN